MYDPSGFDTEARTTALDLKKVVESLLEYQWFRDIVSKSSYKATLPDESTQMWKNTNAFLDSTSDYYNGNVKGVKTGSLSDDYNLVVLYQQHGKEFLICSLGSKSNSSRYDDVNYIITLKVEAKYLHNRNRNAYIRIGLTTFADFLLSFFVGIQDKPVSGVGCRSPPHNLDFSKKFRLEENKSVRQHKPLYHSH